MTTKIGDVAGFLGYALTMVLLISGNVGGVVLALIATILVSFLCDVLGPIPE